MEEITSLEQGLRWAAGSGSAVLTYSLMKRDYVIRGYIIRLKSIIPKSRKKTVSLLLGVVIAVLAYLGLLLTGFEPVPAGWEEFFQSLAAVGHLGFISVWGSQWLHGKRDIDRE